MAVAHSPPNAGKASTQKREEGKSLIFHNKPILISIAFNRNIHNIYEWTFNQQMVKRYLL